MDDTGVGGGVVDRLREQQWHVRAVNFGAAPDASRNEERFLNRRTELWWHLREWIRKDAAHRTALDRARMLPWRRD